MNQITERIADDQQDEIEVCSVGSSCFLGYFDDSGEEIVIAAFDIVGVRKLRDVLNRVLGE